jgi:hypothetical protein
MRVDWGTSGRPTASFGRHCWFDPDSGQYYRGVNRVVTYGPAQRRYAAICHIYRSDASTPRFGSCRLGIGRRRTGSAEAPASASRGWPRDHLALVGAGCDAYLSMKSRTIGTASRFGDSSTWKTIFEPCRNSSSTADR